MKTCLSLLFFFFLSAEAVVAEPPRVLFDEGHGQTFRVGGESDLDLSLLAGQIQRAGGRVATAGKIDPPALADAAALVISGPFHPFAEAEIAAILAFLEKGGRLAVMLHIGPPLAPLLAPLGVYHSNGVVREGSHIVGDQPLNFHVHDLAPHPLFAGIERFSVFGAWALDTDDKAKLVARSGPQAWVDLDRDTKKTPQDASAVFGLAAAGTRGKGEFVVFGDDAIFQNRYLRDYNGALGSRLALWLTQGF